MNEQDDIEQKKTLLKEAILDKNYDQELFIEFCVSKKENGDDLSQWRFEELKEIVDEFVNNQKPNLTELKQELQSSNQSSATPKPGIDIDIDINQIKMSQTKVEEKPSKNIEIGCRKLEKSPLNNPGVVVLIKDPKPVETGFLSSNYVNYQVETALLQWWVRRRYSDFEWLRTVLVKYHPGHVVPPLPNKKIGSRRFEVDFIEKRMKFLQKFMDAVLKSEFFRATEPLNSFLSMTDRSQFEAKMKELSSYQPSPYIEEFKTFSGTVTISSADDKENEKYFTNINNYFRIQTQWFERLNFNWKNFHTSITTACTNWEEVQKDYETWHLLNTRVLMKDPITKSFEQWGIFIKNWKRIMFKQNETIKVHFKDFFKFIQMEGTAYAELIKNREEVKIKYDTEKNKLNAKKEKWWQGMDTTKWEIVDEFNKVDRTLLVRDKTYAICKMCTKETMSLENLKKQWGYANKMNIEELKSMIKINCEKFTENLKLFCEDFYPSLTDGINVYSGLQMYVSSLN